MFLTLNLENKELCVFLLYDHFVCVYACAIGAEVVSVLHCLSHM